MFTSTVLSDSVHILTSEQGGANQKDHHLRPKRRQITESKVNGWIDSLELVRQNSTLLLGDGDLSLLNLLLKVVGGLAVDTAANREASTQDLLHGSGQLLGHGLASHDTGDLNDRIKGDVAVVDNILDLLSVSGGLFELSHDKGRGSRDDRRGGL